MRPHERARPGPTPIIRIDGSVTTYILWIDRPERACEMLVIRCTDDGEISARVCHELETV
jgi:hypothetical protein